MFCRLQRFTGSVARAGQIHCGRRDAGKNAENRGEEQINLPRTANNQPEYVTLG